MADEAGDDAKSSSDSLKPVLEPSVIKAFVAGIVIGNINKGLLLGFFLGSCGGVYIQQNFAHSIPNVSKSWKDLINRWNKTGGGSNSER